MGPIGWWLTDGVLWGVGACIRLAVGGGCLLDHAITLGFENEACRCELVDFGVISLADMAMVGLCGSI